MGEAKTGRQVSLYDGLYLVTGRTLTAGFVVKDGKITECAPILRKLLTGRDADYWLGKAKRVYQVEINEWAIEAHEKKKTNEEAES